MKKSIIKTLAAFIFSIVLVVPAIAENMDHSGHKHSEHKSGENMDHSGHMGKMIRETNTNGYDMAYHLIDMREKTKGKKGMSMTHHLMVYIKSPHGHNQGNAKVGYMLIGPDGNKQKAMAMAMSGGYGADIKLKQKGIYTVKTKVAFEGKKLMDKFTYEVK